MPRDRHGPAFRRCGAMGSLAWPLGPALRRHGADHGVAASPQAIMSPQAIGVAAGRRSYMCHRVWPWGATCHWAARVAVGHRPVAGGPIACGDPGGPMACGAPTTKPDGGPLQVIGSSQVSSSPPYRSRAGLASAPPSRSHAESGVRRPHVWPPRVARAREVQGVGAGGDAAALRPSVARALAARHRSGWAACLSHILEPRRHYIGWFRAGASSGRHLGRPL